jgi:hypothetical protein
MIAQKIDLENYCNNPVQYTHLIFLTPAANKPGELHRINIWGIEIGSCFTKHVPATSNYKDTANQIL